MTERGICIYCGRTFTAHSVFDDLCPRCYAMKYGAPEPIEEDKKGDDGEGKEGGDAREAEIKGLRELCKDTSEI